MLSIRITSEKVMCVPSELVPQPLDEDDHLDRTLNNPEHVMEINNLELP